MIQVFSQRFLRWCDSTFSGCNFHIATTFATHLKTLHSGYLCDGKKLLLSPTPIPLIILYTSIKIPNQPPLFQGKQILPIQSFLNTETFHCWPQPSEFYPHFLLCNRVLPELAIGNAHKIPTEVSDQWYQLSSAHALHWHPPPNSNVHIPKAHVPGWFKKIFILDLLTEQRKAKRLQSRVTGQHGEMSSESVRVQL